MITHFLILFLLLYGKEISEFGHIFLYDKQLDFYSEKSSCKN